MIYGAYGYTGSLITELAASKGIDPILAGRNADKLAPLADKYGFEARAFDLANITDADVAGVQVFLHCAGPFIHTYKGAMDACLKYGMHYLDITGEWEVFEAFAAIDEQAKAAGIMCMPGTGFDVVPSDCLASYLYSKLPDATKLDLAFHTKGKPSRGTQKTVIESLDKGGAIRKNGKIEHVPSAYKTKNIVFSDGKERSTVTIPWGDISTAYHSTGIPNIKVFMSMPEKTIKSMKFMSWLSPVMSSGLVKGFLRSRVDKLPPGPTEKQRASGYVLLWGRVKNDKGQNVETVMKVPDGYTLTSQTALEVALRIQQGSYTPGFRTPAQQYGADFITEFKGVERKEPVQS